MCIGITPSYVVMDVRASWLPKANTEMAVVVRNLLDSARSKFAASGHHLSEVQQEVYGMVTWLY